MKATQVTTSSSLSLLKISSQALLLPSPSKLTKPLSKIRLQVAIERIYSDGDKSHPSNKLNKVIQPSAELFHTLGMIMKRRRTLTAQRTAKQNPTLISVENEKPLPMSAITAYWAQQKDARAHTDKLPAISVWKSTLPKGDHKDVFPAGELFHYTVHESHSTETAYPSC